MRQNSWRTWNPVQGGIAGKMPLFPGNQVFRMRFSRDVAAAVCLSCFSSLACAAQVWPALALEIRLFSWWAVGLALIVDFFLVRRLFGGARGKSVLAVLAADVLVVLADFVLVPLSGMLWGFVAAWSYQRWFGWETFNPLTWLVTLLLAICLNTVLKAVVWRFGFRFRIGRRELLWTLLVNAIIAVIAFGSLWLMPISLF